MKVIRWIIVICIALGALLLIVGISQDGSFSDLGALVTNDSDYGDMITHTFENVSEEITIDVTTRHISVHLVDADVITMTYYEREDDTWTFVDLEDGIRVTQRQSNILGFFLFNFTSRKVHELHLYLPDNLVYALDLKATTGSINLSANFRWTLDVLDVQVTTGDVKLSGFDVLNEMRVTGTTGDINIQAVTADALEIIMTTGDIEIIEVVLEDAVDITTTTGSITLNQVIASSYDVRATTGSVLATFQSVDEMSFDLKTTTGNVRYLGENHRGSLVVYPSDTRTIPFLSRVTTGDVTIRIS